MTNRRDNLIGICWMIAAMAAFAVEDTLMKMAGKTMPLGQVLVLFGIGGMVCFGTIAAVVGENLRAPEVNTRVMKIRAAFETTGRLVYFLAITLTPLSSATVILQATPLVVVIGAAWYFQEHVSWQRWCAIIVGLIGVLIVLRPGGDGFSTLSLLAVVGMLGLAGRDLASRAAPATLGTATLGFYGFLTVIVAGIGYAVWQGNAFVWPTQIVAIIICGAVIAGVSAYACLMKAMRMGDVSAVTPLRYTRLIFGVCAGAIVFGETVTPNMVLGSILIVISGVFVLWQRPMREQNRLAP
mgnify:FL=1